MTLTTIIGALLGGIALGAVYFALLQRSVRSVTQGAGAPLVFLASLGLRLALAAATFYAAVHLGGWVALLGTLAGFLAVRTAVTWRRVPPASAPEHGA